MSSMGFRTNLYGVLLILLIRPGNISIYEDLFNSITCHEQKGNKQWDAIASRTTIHTAFWKKKLIGPFQPSSMTNVTTSIFVIYVSQLIRYARAYSLHGDFVDRGRLLTKKLVYEGYMLSKVLWSMQWSITTYYTIQYFPFAVFVWPCPLLLCVFTHLGFSECPCCIECDIYCCIECDIYSRLSYLYELINDFRLTGDGRLFPSLYFLY